MEALRFFSLLVALCSIGDSPASCNLLESLIADAALDFEEIIPDEDTADVKDEDKEDSEQRLGYYCDYLYNVLGISYLRELTEELTEALSDFGIEPETQVERPPMTYNHSLSIPAAVYNDLYGTTVNSGSNTAELPSEPPTSSVNKPQFINSLLIPSVLPPGEMLPTNQTAEDSLTIALASDLVDDTD